MKLSATIVTLNEEPNIARAIESLRCADEIIVVDSGSTDRTCQIAEARGARVVNESWRGYAAQKNFAAACASYDWILSLDADECLGEELEVEILDLKRLGPGHDAYQFPRLAQYLGRWIRHSGWYPDCKIRLYHREHGRWEGDYVHESVRIRGSIGRLNGHLLHFTCNSLGDHLRSIDRYTTLAARELHDRKAEVSLRHLTIDPFWALIRTYFVDRGFLDGPQGAAIAWMAALYTFLKYAKALELTGRM